jgi:aryl-alcohol dehydrogenase-like predicted oxidoreductase
MPEIALKWAMAGPGITSSLCGSRSLSHLKMNIRAASEPLPPNAVDELNRATQPLLEKLGPSFDYYEHPSNDRTK